MDSSLPTDALGSNKRVAMDVRRLSKAYRTGFLRRPIPALRDVSFTVLAGSVFALLGPNGSGKTTLLKIAMGLVRPDQGSIHVLEQALNSAVRGKIGFLPDKPHHHAFLSPWETLSFYADLFGLYGQRKKDGIEKVLALVQMQDKKDIPLRYFSKGMIQRVALAQALINDPDLLILDEPIGTLDPRGVRLMKNIFVEMKKLRKTVIFSSHFLNYAQEICDNFAILDRGQLVRQGNLRTGLQGRSLEDIFLEAVPRGE